MSATPKDIHKEFEAMSDSVLAAIGSRDQKITSLEDRLEQLEALGDRPRGGGSKAENSPEAKAFLDYARGDKGALSELKEMSIGGGASSGQALVPENIANQIFMQAIQQSEIARRCTITPTATSDYVRLVNLGDQAASWSSETGTRSATNTFNLRERRPTHGELYSLVTVSNWLLNDSKFDLMAMIRNVAASQFAKALDTAIYSGSGSNQPTGIFHTAPVSTDDTASPIRSAEAIEYIDTTSDIANDMIELYFGLNSAYRRNATFAMSSAVLGTVRQQRDSSGSGYLWQQSLGSSMDAPDGLLVGRPVVTWEDLPAAYTSSPLHYPVVCGDFAAGYEITRIQDMSVIIDQVTTKGKTLIYLYQRVGGILADNNAIKCIRA